MLPARLKQAWSLYLKPDCEVTVTWLPWGLQVENVCPQVCSDDHRVLPAIPVCDGMVSPMPDLSMFL